MTGLQLPLDRARLRADVDGIGPDEWLSHYNNQDYGGDWRGVPLRSLRGSASDLSASVATPATNSLRRLHCRAAVICGRCWAHFPAN